MEPGGHSLGARFPERPSEKFISEKIAQSKNHVMRELEGPQADGRWPSKSQSRRTRRRALCL